jgi:hypothetical protein
VVLCGGLGHAPVTFKRGDAGKKARSRIYICSDLRSATIIIKKPSTYNFLMLSLSPEIR